MNLKKFFDLLPYEVIEEKFKNINVKFGTVDYFAGYIWNEPDSDVILIWATKKGVKAHENIEDKKLKIDNHNALKFIFEKL